MQTTTLRPGLLVSLKTSLTGNVTYDKKILELEHITEGGTERAKWETEREVMNPVEYEEAKKIRGKARSLIGGVCAHSAFGLLCPESRTDDLEGAISEARALVRDFNATAQLTRISVYIITGRVARDDAEAVRAINSEVRDLIDAMAQGVKSLDVQAVRDAANKARDIGAMLSPEAEEKVKLAIDAARSVARRIVKAGDAAAAEIDIAVIRQISEQRTAFLDLDEAEATKAPEAVPGRALDLLPVVEDSNAL